MLPMSNLRHMNTYCDRVRRLQEAVHSSVFVARRAPSERQRNPTQQHQAHDTLQSSHWQLPANLY